MTGPESERLAVLETKVDMLASDVSEIRTDVKSLMAHMERTDAQQVARAEARGATGVWVRSAIPWVIGAMAVLLTLVNTFDIVAGK